MNGPFLQGRPQSLMDVYVFTHYYICDNARHDNGTWRVVLKESDSETSKLQFVSGSQVASGRQQCHQW